MQHISNKVVSRIYGHGRGWVFTKKDLSDCGGSMAVEKALLRLRKKGTVRLLIRGVYDYPRFSRLFDGPASPEASQIAQAIARKFGWSIYPSGETALNLLGLSTQVPAKYVFYSDGPSKKYDWKGGELVFIKRTIKETSSLSRKTVLVVQALKALGQKNVDQELLSRLTKKLSTKEKSTALREARYVTGWVYDAIQKMAASGGTNG
jgi:hypothetical protein